MLRADIDYICVYKQKMPKSASTKDMIYYYCVDRLYSDYDKRTIDKEEARAIKSNITSYLDTLESLARSNSKIITELSKLTAPRKELANKDQAQLLEVIARIEAIVTGLMKEHDGKLPEFLKLEVKE